MLVKHHAGVASLPSKQYREEGQRICFRNLQTKPQVVICDTSLVQKGFGSHDYYSGEAVFDSDVYYESSERSRRRTTPVAIHI